MQTTKVIFRKFKCGGIIALFPEIAASRDGWGCKSYMHIGQHGGASPFLVRDTVLATPEEYTPLLVELEAIGYNNLAIAARFSRVAYSIRRRDAGAV